MDGLKGLKIDDQPLVDRPKPTADSKLGTLLKIASALRPGKMMERLLWGCLCSAVVGVFMNLPYAKMMILWICQGVIFVFGRPDVPEPVKKKLDGIVAKGREIAERAEAHKERHPVLPLKALKERVESKVKEEVVEKVTDRATAPVKEAATKTKEKVVSAGKAVKQEAQKVGDKLDKVADSLADAALKRQEEAAKQKAEAERQDLIRRAVALHIPWQGRSTEELCDAVTAAEAKRAPNAQCPYCREPRRIIAKHGDFRCPRCGGIYSARTARSLGPPTAPLAQRPAVRLPFSSRGATR